MLSSILWVFKILQLFCLLDFIKLALEIHCDPIHNFKHINIRTPKNPNSSLKTNFKQANTYQISFYKLQFCITKLLSSEDSENRNAKIQVDIINFNIPSRARSDGLSRADVRLSTESVKTSSQTCSFTCHGHVSKPHVTLNKQQNTLSFTSSQISLFSDLTPRFHVNRTKNHTFVSPRLTLTTWAIIRARANHVLLALLTIRNFCS